MEPHLQIGALWLLGLIMYTLAKGPLKGEFFHPAFIFCLINSIIFIVFTFGPYEYTYQINWFYPYTYLLIISSVIGGIFFGYASGRKKLVKEIKLTSSQLSRFYLIALVSGLVLVVPLILLTGGSLENAVTNRFETYNSGAERSDVVSFLLGNAQSSLNLISTAVISSYCVVQKRNYHRIGALFLIASIYALFLNSRTDFILILITIIISLYTTLKLTTTWHLSKSQILKNIKLIVPSVVIGITVIVFLTNLRSSVTNKETVEFPYETIEKLLQVTRKAWFEPLVFVVPDSIMNPISQLSLYAGSTFACGGAVAKIALYYGLYTWGGRSLTPFHRVLERSGLGAELVATARDNYDKILEISGRPEIFYAWLAPPGYFTVDFGLIGAPLVSIIIGWIVGWIYGSVSKSGPILKSTATSILVTSMIMTPATSPFGFLSSTISYLWLGWYLLAKSYKKTSS
jgi:hypothetical protein